MAHYVVINLAEESDAGTGVTAKVRDAMLEQGKRSVTTGCWFKTTTIHQDNTVNKYDLVNAFNRNKVGFWYGISLDTLLAIRMDCLKADRVYLCAHGSATDRNQVFAQRGRVGASRVEMLATVVEFSNFVQMVLDPAASKIYELHLIVCFAARSANPDRVHSREFLSNPESNHDALASSLAYKLYKDLTANGVKTRTYARLGEVRVSLSSDRQMDILTQTEEGVLGTLALSEAAAEEQRLGAAIPESRKAELRMLYQMDQRILPRNDTITAPTLAERPYYDAYTRATLAKANSIKEAQRTGDGVVVYRQEGATLVIEFEGGEIYRGPAL